MKGEGWSRCVDCVNEMVKHLLATRASASSTMRIVCECTHCLIALVTYHAPFVTSRASSRAPELYSMSRAAVALAAVAQTMRVLRFISMRLTRQECNHT
jgi:hypothetical protein